MKDNKLIADFMGWDIESPTTIPSNLHLSNLELDSGEVWLSIFHTSWDWLMPVIEEIDHLQHEPIQSIDDALATRHIGDTYQAVLEFINEYNQNK